MPSTLGAACCFCAALLEASGYDAHGLSRAVADVTHPSDEDRFRGW